MGNSEISKDRLKVLLIENLMLDLRPEQISDSQPLFGPDGLGLDSVDALQIVVALDKNYGLKIPDPASAQKILQSIDTIFEALQLHLASQTS